ncbi:MAG: hypothetical protein HZB26_08635, partial [Candidatus Hydrogenedentes bacterium]|nr:hypothetical protein [Candidatus Hydrogenedentota bacterium]
GRYNYIVRGLATGKLGAGFVRPEPLKLEGMCPAYKTFTARPKRFESLGAVKDVRLDYPDTVISPVARGMRADKDRDYVWQPLIKGYDADNVWCTTPAATMWHKSGATWTYLGFSPKPDALAEMCRRLAASLAQRPAFEEGVGPLLDARQSGDCVKVEGDQFTLAGKRWFAHGINFWPLYVTGLEPTEYFFNWLAPQYYYPELVEQDLATLERLGINLVSVQYNKTEEAPQLRDFAARCGSHGVKVNVFLGTAHPISPSATDDLSKRPFVELLATANLRGIPSVFGYDLAWEPIVGAYAARKMYDPLFETWITEQYGSLERAEKVWGIAANRAEGKVTGPLDKQLTEDGPQRAMVAAYRRFLDDLISHRYREVIRLARGIDPTHLFGVRSGYGGTGTLGVVPNMPFQLTSGAAHLDFISPEGYGYGPKNISDAALVNQYARWAGHGKPVFWAEFGLTVWNGGQPALDRQKEMYEAFASIALQTGAAGWAPWWYPGGYRVDEQSDYGIIAPDRTPRPSALVMQRMGPQLAKGGALPAGDALTFAHDGKPQGIAATVQELSKAFGAAYSAGRLPTLETAGTGTTSTDCPMTGVGGVAFEAPGPPEYLNAEAWVVKRANGRMRIALLNTGEATWKAEDCSALVTGASGKESIAIPKDVAPFAQVEVECADPGAATVAVQSRRFGAFGERVAISAP